MEKTVKQVLVVRKDLNMRKGKIASQCAHASMKIFFDRMEYEQPVKAWELSFEMPTLNPNPPHWINEAEEKTYAEYSIIVTDKMKEWIEGAFTKIVCYVNSEHELRDLEYLAGTLNIPTAMIIDKGLTEFNGVPTRTVLAIGPDDSEKINEVTGKLPLL